MSHSLVKKFDKIVSKLGNKSNKESKSNNSESNNDGQHQTNSDENNAPDSNAESNHESILQRMKGHLGHSHKPDQHHNEGPPPAQHIINELKDSPFKGKMRFG